MKRNIHNTKNILEVKKIKTDIILEQDTINYVSVSSLESMASVNVAVSLCKQPDIRDAIWQHSLNFASVKDVVCPIVASNESVNQIEENVFNKLSHLPLPNLLKVKVANIVRPILLQMLKWIHNGWNDIEYMNSICWTTEGIIDRARTVEQLAERDTGKHIYIIYKLACIYCLEDILPNLWNKLPETVQKYYLGSKNVYETYDDYLIAYWSSFLNNELLNKTTSYYVDNNKHDLYHKMFTSSLIMDNSFAVKYFWKKLTDVEINNNLAQWVRYACSRIHSYNFEDSQDCFIEMHLLLPEIYDEHQKEVVNLWYNLMEKNNNMAQCVNSTCRRTHSFKYQDTNDSADILYFLLSKINCKEQQREILQQNYNVILMSLFAYFPWQKYLLATMQVLWEFIDEKVYVELLLKIVKEIKKNKITANLFRELWYDSPVNLQKTFIQHMSNDYEGTDVLHNLLTAENVETIKVLLNYANIEEKKQIAFNFIENSRLFQVIYASNFYLVDIFLEVFSELGINYVKEKIVFKDGSNLCLKWMHDNNWKMVEKFFSWAFSSQEQNNYFKNKVLNKMQISYFFVLNDNYELLNKFINWYFTSEQEANEFKLKILQYSQTFIFNQIVYLHSFESVDKLISWCCHFNEEIIKHYKSEFIISDKFICIIQEFVKQVYNFNSDEWESIRKLISFFSPIEDDVIIKLKKNIIANIKFDHWCKNSIKQEKKISETLMKYLLHLIDVNNH